MRRSSRLIEIGAGLREQGRRPLVVMATDGSAFELEFSPLIRSALSVRRTESSDWLPTSTTSGRTRGTLSSCGTRTTFSLSATNVTAGRRRVRMAVLEIGDNDGIRLFLFSPRLGACGLFCRSSGGIFFKVKHGV